MRTLGSVPALWLTGCLWISPAEHAARLDGDGDGALGDVDCDDADPTVSPQLPEQPCDGVDNDCNPETPDGPAFVRLSDSQVSTFESVQQAVDAAVPPQEVVVCGAVVHEQVVLARAGLALRGLPGAELNATGLDGPVVTVAAPDVSVADLAVTGGTGLALTPDGAPAGRYGGGVCAMEAGGRVTLRRVVVTGGAADHGGGVAGMDLVLEGCELGANSAVAGGGGLWVGASAVVTGTNVVGNTAEAGGGIDLAPGASATLDDASEVAENEAARGGGVRVAAEGVLTGGVVRANRAAAVGGGVHIDGASLVGVEVRENEAPRGGGIAGSGRLEAVAVTGNTADEGGGMLAEGDVTAVIGLFSANVAGQGGGVLVSAGRFAIDHDPARVERPRFLANRAEGGWGGAIAVTGGVELDIANADLVDNHAAYGGAVAVRDGDPPCEGCVARITDSVIDANVATTEGGAVWSDRVLLLRDTTLTGNRSDGPGGAMVLGGGAELELAAFVSNTAGADGGAVLIGSGEVAFRQASLSLNTALGRGAAIMVRPSPPATAEAVLDGTELRANHAVSSGAVALTPAGATLEVRGGTTWEGNVDFDVEVGGDGCFAEPGVAFVCAGGTCGPGCAP